jgi:hypothetical protein
VPVAAATDVIVKGIEVIAWPFHAAKKEPRLNQSQFFKNYYNHSYRYYGCITNVDTNENMITFVASGTSKQSYVVTAHLSDTNSLTVLRTGLPIWISGKFKLLEEIDEPSAYANRLVFFDSMVYPPETLSPTNELPNL